MAIRHRDWNLRGIQFHPESVMTPSGYQIMKNWMETLS
jgi:anthranilate synthase component 2